MAKESMQKKLDRVRPPRVQIKYEVEIGDAMEMKELPFVLGVLGDYSGKPEKPLPPLKQRKFVNIDRDNFDKVLEGMAPRAAYRVDDKLSGEEGKQLNVELKFKNMDDFHPENVARQIEPLRQLLETRDKLKDLLGKLEGNDKLDELLQNVLNSTEAQQALKKDLGVEDAGNA
jgi:type VI secretion system protein ImpB